MCVDDIPFFAVFPPSHYHGRRISCLPWLSFYGLAGDSVHNMKFTLILIPALGPIVSFKFSLLCTNLTPGLLDALRPTGYRPAQKRLSPRQLQILFSYLGEP